MRILGLPPSSSSRYRYHIHRSAVFHTKLWARHFERRSLLRMSLSLVDAGALLDSTCKALHRELPTAPIEPLALAHEPGISCTLGFVRTPAGVRDGGIRLTGLPQFARNKGLYTFELSLDRSLLEQPAADLAFALADIVLHTHIFACLRVVSLHSGVVNDSQMLAWSSKADFSAGSVRFSTSIPAGTAMRNVSSAALFISDVRIAGQVLASNDALPACIPITTGLIAPQRLVVEGGSWNDYHTPAIKADGTLFVAKRDVGHVIEFDSVGSVTRKLQVDDLGLCNDTCAAGVSEETNTLLLADWNSSDSRLVAVDLATGRVRWSAVGFVNCAGLAVLPAQGVVVASSYRERKLYVHSLASGARVGSSAPSSAEATTDYTNNVTFVAAHAVPGDDAESREVFASFGKHVHQLTWNGATLAHKRVVQSAALTGDGVYRPLAIVPRSSIDHTPYLIAASYNSKSEAKNPMFVLSLPDLNLIHKHVLTDVFVTGIAADPQGSALVVCDSKSDTVLVLPWPLPGMPGGPPTSDSAGML
jgi:hypothetical protein